MNDYENIQALRDKAQQHRKAANDSHRYEVYFHEMQKASLLDRQIAALEDQIATSTCTG